MGQEENREYLHEIRQGIITINENLEQIEGLLKELILTGKIDLDNAEIFMHMAAWNRVIGEMQVIKGALSRIK
ncbi:hypothetical protein [Adhaeribacter pallidiroseus]|uniref:Uncharacterized protein n=1 Tax=Adhaeribacter pallidiroseus TaxID=2072847 RepID=A0A369QIL6_9BACT|nr:hypothetical protein [Adhaeribacter pallidiroseus]RDC64140.1 hypothetical protein AHMF7616_02751 [Adhaeribacter pallidiroseus]